MAKKIAIVFSICLFIIIGVFSYHFVSINSIHKIHSVNITNYDDGYMYGIDMASDRYYIFRVNVDTGKQEYFTYPIEYKENTIMLNNMVCDSKGKIYLHMSQKKSGSEYTDTIEYCNFEKGRLETVWNVKDISDNVYLIMYITKNDDYVLSTYNNDENALTTYKLLDNGKSEELGNVKLTDSAYLIYNDSTNNNLYAFTINGDIDLIENYKTSRKIFVNDGSKVGMENVNYDFDNGDIHFLNLDTGNNYKITSESNYEKIEPCFEHKVPYAETFNASDLYNDFEKEGIYAGTLDLEDGRNVPAICGEKEFVLDELTWTHNKILLVSVILTFAFSAILFAYIYIFYKMWKIRGGAPVLGIATMLILPVIVAGTVSLFYFIDNSKIDKIKQKVQQLAVVSEIVKEKMDLYLFESYRILDRLDFNNILNFEIQLNEHQKITDSEDNTDRYVNENTVARLYFYKNNEIFSSTSYYQFGIPMDYQVALKPYKCMKEAAEKNEIVYTEYNDNEGRYISVFTPIENDNGEVIGVLEITENIIVLELDILKNAITIKRFLLAAAAVIFVLIQAVLWINTRPLKVLRQAMTDLAKGNLSARADIHGNYEIASIADEFNKMADLIENRVSEIETFQIKYEAFVPSKLFYLLNKNGIKEAFAGDGANFNAVVMALNSAGYKLAVIKKYDEVFAYSNTYLPEEIPVIHSFGGVIRRIFEGGAETIFTKEVQKNAVECAIALMQKLKNNNEGFCIGIAKEDLRFGVIGLPKRMVTVTISEHGSLSWFLQQMASKFSTPILITGSAAEEIQNFDKLYNTRIIGYLYMTSSNKLEIIYEVLNGDKQERQRLKLDTKAEFEEGVRLFMSKSYTYARKRFIHVLQNDKNDGAAKEYVLLCDMRLKGEKIDPWIDKY